ncbi:MAG: hemolysin family protein [Mangrovibacterium sp.]|nr:hemolysin family protein [Mangrovibacterium sp.]
MGTLIIILISIVFAAFFSGMEIAFASAAKLGLVPDKNLHPATSRMRSFLARAPGQYHATMRMGYLISLVVFGVFFSLLLEPAFYRILGNDLAVLAAQTIVATLVILITSEMLSDILFRFNPALVLRFFATPLLLFYVLFYPVTNLFIRISGSFPAPTPQEHQRINGAGDGRRVPEKEEPLFVHNETNTSGVKLFRNALGFSKVKLREIMVPRTEMAALDIHSGLEDLRRKFIETGYSRILFYQDDIDHVVGYVHHSAIFSKPQSIHSAMKDVLMVPETMTAGRLLHIFIQQHRSIAIVVDEFGGTSGMVTSEDILEEIFGEIEDEHDTVDWIEKQISAGEYIFSARIDLDLINEKYHLGFPPDENYETLAGYILFHRESIPKINTLVTIGPYRFKILKATNTRIELVHLKLLSS